MTGTADGSRLCRFEKIVITSYSIHYTKLYDHGQLGSQGDRVERVRQIARAIGERLGGPAMADLAKLAVAEWSTRPHPRSR